MPVALQAPTKRGVSAPPRSLSAAVHFFLCSFATIQLVWFYLASTPCSMQVVRYEQGLESTPFQYRLLLMYPFRWAHHSAPMLRASAGLSRMPAWFPHGVTPEGLVEAIVDFFSVAVTGIMAGELYRRSSRSLLFLPLIYPLTLLMIAGTYTFATVHGLRFPYDLPAMAFFSTGLYLIYSRRHIAWFVALFCVATLNRETTLLLLAFFLLEACSRDRVFVLRRAWERRSVAVALPLGTAWLLWHLWVVRHYAHNASAAGPRLLLNLGLLVIPLAWPQLLSMYGYALPMVLVGRRSIPDFVLRKWLWVLPLWFVFMLFYGLLLEVRIFGELIAYIACLAALITEEKVADILARRTYSTRPCPVE